MIDPLTSKYPWNSSFSFSENRIIDSKEIDGLEPIVLNGMLIGYRVENGQGPIAIANDLNNPETQKKYGYSLITKVSYLDIVNSNPKKFNVVKNKYDINDSGFKKLDIQKGDVLSVSTIIKREKEIQKDNKLVLAQIEANINKIKIIKMEDSGPYMSENDIKIQQEAISDGYDGEPTSTGESLSVISVRLIAHQINEAHDRKEANKTKRIEALRQANNDLRKKLIVKNE